jgi:hypothetical protein
MKPDHVRVHAFGINQVSADLAGNIAGQVRDRLLDQWFCSSLPPAPSLVPALFTV